MTRRYRDQTFRKADAVRALRAAQTAGVPHPRLQIDRYGTITIVPGKPLKASDGDVANDTESNDWDGIYDQD
jgi:hypothetical protein